MSNTTTAAVTGTNEKWNNWSKNLYYSSADGNHYYFMPSSRAELQSIILGAAGKTVRVSGQRHSQTPLVAGSATSADLVLIDMSCYADLGDGTARMVVNGNTVTVNCGVLEGDLDAFLTNNNLMLQTVTAGGFFSVGGMTAVDVHGATVDAPIFSETASEFSIMMADGQVHTINAQTPMEGNWQPLQFARVSLGTLGVVTSVTLNVLPRPFANSLQGGTEMSNFYTPLLETPRNGFIKNFGQLLNSKTRVETFFNPYADTVVAKSFLACWWNADTGSGAGNSVPMPEDACTLAGQDKYGAPYFPAWKEILGEQAAYAAQDASSYVLAYGIALTAMGVVQSEVGTAVANNSDLWLTEAARTIFLSYFIKLPDLGDAGMGLVWDALQAVKAATTPNDAFHIAAPMEFRFVKSGNSAMAGTYDDGDCHFVNLDLIGFVPTNSACNGLDYSDKMKSFFATVERSWVQLGGLPHNGKMYGFYDPAGAPGNFSEPFNPGFLSFLQQQRGARAQALNAYRKKCDPTGMFSNGFVNALIGS